MSWAAKFAVLCSSSCVRSSPGAGLVCAGRAALTAPGYGQRGRRALLLCLVCLGQRRKDSHAGSPARAVCFLMYEVEVTPASTCRLMPTSSAELTGPYLGRCSPGLRDSRAVRSKSRGLVTCPGSHGPRAAQLGLTHGSLSQGAFPRKVGLPLRARAVGEQGTGV